MASIYEVEFNYLDEDRKKDGEHTAYACVYKTGTPSGDTLQYAIDCVDEDGDDSGLNKLLRKMFGLADEDVCFYFDEGVMGDEKTWNLEQSLEQEFDIKIYNIRKVMNYE